MFGPFASAEKKTRASAASWLELAQKIWHFRRDVLSPPLLRELETRLGELQGLLRERADATRLKSGIEALEETLRRAGGVHYPKSETVEWVEFLLVAAIVIIGLRTYFVQPFQIPTNSMWPSYYGMTAKVYPTLADEPGPVKTALRVITAGVRPDRIRRVNAPVSGEVLIPLVQLVGGGASMPFAYVTGRSLFVFPDRQREYRLMVGDQFVTVRVPEDFDLDAVVRDTFYPEIAPPQESLGRQLARGRTVETVVPDGEGGQRRMLFLRTGKVVPAGGRVLSFDILAGDMLMVDRFSYNFVRPAVGDGFVFHTGNIHSDYMVDRNTGGQIDQYYIKRLVGVPGDTLQVDGSVLERNGAPITGAAAFGKNARRDGLYPGYRAQGLLGAGQTVTVPPHGYFAMGDNSPNSQDSRYWGFVPAPDVVGRPLFIYYPFARLLP